jgi:hypothetical protein
MEEWKVGRMDGWKNGLPSIQPSILIHHLAGLPSPASPLPPPGAIAADSLHQVALICQSRPVNPKQDRYLRRKPVGSGSATNVFPINAIGANIAGLSFDQALAALG